MDQDFRTRIEIFSWEHIESRQFPMLLLSPNFIQRRMNTWKFRGKNEKRSMKIYSRKCSMSQMNDPRVTSYSTIIEIQHTLNDKK